MMLVHACTAHTRLTLLDAAYAERLYVPTGHMLSLLALPEVGVPQGWKAGETAGDGSAQGFMSTPNQG